VTAPAATLLDASPMGARQLLSIADSQARINIWEGAVRSGKTVASLLRWLMFVANAPAGGELLMIGRTRETIHRNLFVVLQNPDLFGELSEQVKYTPGAPMATILGRRVHVIGANDIAAETKIRGLTVAGAYVDEITILPRVFWDQLIARMSVVGAKLFGTTNPDSPSHWLKADWLGKNDPSIRSWHFTLDDNKSLDPEYVAHLKRMYVGLWYRRFILGQWVVAEGAIYDMWDPQVHVVANVPIITDWLTCAVDYGTTNPFHAVMIGIGVDSRLYVTREYRYDSRAERRQLTDVDYSRRLRQWMRTVPIPGTAIGGVTPQYVVIDPSATSFRVQLHQDGVSSWPADNTVVDGIRLVASLLGASPRPKLLIHRSCKYLIDELPAYSWDEKYQLKGEDKPIKVNDHGCDALRYGLFTTRSVWQSRLDIDA
jgi:PBSX family phage terminase large subunit